MATKNLLIRGGADFSALKRETEKAQKALSNFKKTTSESMASVGKSMDNLNKHINHSRHGFSAMYKDMIKMSIVMAAVTATFAPLIAAITGVKSAMDVEASVQQINRTMGESSSVFQEWAKDQSAAFGMSKAEALKYGAVYSNLISGFSKSTTETMNNTEALLKASAVVASGTARSMEDVMERIRSGMLGNTESIEDLGINVNVAMIESTAAFKRFAGDKSWQQLDFQTQQQIRLMAILEQASIKYGSSLNQNTATNQQLFIAQLKNAQLALGQAFLPIYNVVLPALTNMAAALASVLNVVAQFTQALFGKTAEPAQTKATIQQSKAVSGLGDSYKEAGKKAKGALAGFDEINSLSKGAGGGAGGAGGSDITSSLPEIGAGVGNATTQVTAKIQEMANKVKQAFRDVADFMSQNKDLIISAITGIASAFIAFQIITNWTNIVGFFSKAMQGLGAVMAGISLPILAVSLAIGAVIAIIVYLWRTNEEFRNNVIKLWQQIKDSVTAMLAYMWQTIKDLWDNHIKGLVLMLGQFLVKLIELLAAILNKFVLPLISMLVDLLSPVVAGAFKLLIDVISRSVAFIADIAKGLVRAFGGIIEFITGAFTGNWSKAWNGIKDIFRGVFESLYPIVKGPINFIIDAINALIGGVNKLSGIDVPRIPGVTEGFRLGFNIPKIPKLAQGGYVGANNPMLAMIGDNRMEGEIVAPESKIYEQTYRAIKDAMGSGNAPIDLTVNLGGTTVFREIINGINQAQRQAGKTLITV